MKYFFKIQVMIVFIASVFSYAQTPSYEFFIKNDKKTALNRYEFDVMLKRTGSTEFRLYGVQLGLTFNKSISNGGNLTGEYIAGSSALPGLMVPNNPRIDSVYGSSSLYNFKVAAMIDTTRTKTVCPVVPATGDGLKIGRFRIITSASSFADQRANLQFSYSLTNNRYKTEIAYTDGSNTGNIITDSTKNYNLLDNPFLRSLNLDLTVLIEGRMSGSTMTAGDTVYVYLRNSTAPYAVVDSAINMVNQSGTGNFFFPAAQNNVNYYLAVKHRNSLETWSKLTQPFSSFNLNYNFTSSADKAYGDNLKQVGTKWCLYSGDVNQDGQVSLDDLLSIDSDNQNFVSGYIVTDVNGDDQVTLDDLLITDSNNQQFISASVPSKLITGNKKTAIRNQKITE